MLIKCVECESSVSDKAIACPHCGYPMNKSLSKDSSVTFSHKRRRLPNGFGQITKIRGKFLRKPFRVMVCVGKNEYGRPISKLLKPQAYFSTYNEAYDALVNYNKSPYDIDDSITMSELYDRWSNIYFKNLSHSRIVQISCSWKYCSIVYNTLVSDIRVKHIKLCMEEGFLSINNKKRYPSSNTKSRIKETLSLILDYAVEYELIDKNHARSFKLPKEISKDLNMVSKKHITFSDKEIDTFWSNIDYINGIDMVLIQCYTGLRPSELCEIKTSNINISEKYFICGMKTTAGKNRTVPIHSKIYDIFIKRYESAVSCKSEYLFVTENNNKFNYKEYRYIFDSIINNLNVNKNHRPHDCRVYFTSIAKRYKVDEFAIKRIVGHSISDITEKIYTIRDVKWLLEEIEKIK